MASQRLFHFVIYVWCGKAGLHSNPGRHQGVISVTVRAVVAACVENVVERITLCDD